MAESNHTVIIHGSKDAAEAIRLFIDGQLGSQSQVTDRKNLDGDVAGWIVVANLAGQTLPHLLGFIKDRLASKQVTSIEWDGIKIEHPTPEQLEKFGAMLDAKGWQAHHDD
jgi:hypothetical protein